MSEISQLEPFKAEYFDKYFKLNNNCFAILFDEHFYYQDWNFEYCTESIFFISYVNNIYTIKLFREADQKLILNIKLEKMDSQVNLLNIDLETAFKYENKKEHNIHDIKDLVIFSLTFVNGKSKEFKFDTFSEKNKTQYFEVFKKLNINY